MTPYEVKVASRVVLYHLESAPRPAHERVRLAAHIVVVRGEEMSDLDAVELANGLDDLARRIRVDDGRGFCGLITEDVHPVLKDRKIA